MYWKIIDTFIFTVYDWSVLRFCTIVVLCYHTVQIVIN
jgi:hypothetical protein